MKTSAKQPKTIHLVTHDIGEAIDLRRAQELLRRYSFLNRDHPLVVEIAKGQHAVFTKFGTVSFWNTSSELRESILREVAPAVREYHTEYVAGDALSISLGAKEERVTFEELYIRSLDLERIKIISYASAQSVALDHYEKEIDAQLAELGKVARNLKLVGRTRFTQRELLKRVGSILSVKQNVVSNLSLLDKPDETWERPEIETLYNRLRSAYELQDRFDALNEKIDFLTENNTTLLDFISAQRGNFLELVIVVLIVIEIMLFGFEIFGLFPQ